MDISGLGKWGNREMREIKREPRRRQGVIKKDGRSKNTTSVYNRNLAQSQHPSLATQDW